jgi:signal transduction histidine kinase
VRYSLRVGKEVATTAFRRSRHRFHQVLSAHLKDALSKDHLTDNTALPDTKEGYSDMPGRLPGAKAGSKSFRIFTVVLEGTAFRVQIQVTDPGIGTPSEQLDLILIDSASRCPRPSHQIL